MRLPLGFADLYQLRRFVTDLGEARGADGGAGEAHVIGTAATFFSYNLERPSGHCFDKAGPRTSDVDVVLKSAELLMKMRETGCAQPDPGTTFGGKYVWLTNDSPGGLFTVCVALRGFVERWSRELRRPVDLRLLIAVPGQPSHLDEMMNTSPPPIELFPFAGIFPPENRISVGEECSLEVSPTELRMVEPDGRMMGLPWELLDAVDIETTGDGPDVFWVIGSGDTRALLPQGLAGEDALVDKLTSLPGFDHEAMTEAMTCSEPRVFTCWRKP